MSEKMPMVVGTSVLLFIFAAVCIAGGAGGVAGADVATVRATLTVACVAHFLFCVYVYRDAILQFAVMRYTESQKTEKGTLRARTVFVGGVVGGLMGFIFPVLHDKIKFPYFGLIIMLIVHFFILLRGHLRCGRFFAVGNVEMHKVKERFAEEVWPNIFGLPGFFLMLGIMASIVVLAVFFYGGKEVFVSVFMNNNFSFYRNGWYHLLAYVYFSSVFGLFSLRLFVERRQRQ